MSEKGRRSLISEPSFIAVARRYAIAIESVIIEELRNAARLENRVNLEKRKWVTDEKQHERATNSDKEDKELIKEFESETHHQRK